MDTKKFLKFLGKHNAYMGLLLGIAGIVYTNLPAFLIGVLVITFGCIMHEYMEN